MFKAKTAKALVYLVPKIFRSVKICQRTNKISDNGNGFSNGAGDTRL